MGKITYAVMNVSKSLNERRVGTFEAKNDKEAKNKFRRWWPERGGYLRYKLYRLIKLAESR